MKASVLIAIVLLSLVMSCKRSPETIVELTANHWFELHNNFKDTSDVWGNYTLDLSMESLLVYDSYTGEQNYMPDILEILKKRNIDPVDTINYRLQPFCSLNYLTGKLSGDSRWFTGYISESYRMYNEAVKSQEGAIMLNHKGGNYVLVDYLQEYASRLARTGHLTSDTLLFEECVSQFGIYEELLRDAETGLWSQGRGWCEDTTKLGEGAWSRGHGWLLRGLVTSMQVLPAVYRDRLEPVLQRTADALLMVQSESGMWHILLHRDPKESSPDVSGTGMISYYLAIALQEKWINADFREPLTKATQAIKTHIGEEGEIYNSTMGPGPLCDDDEYINYVPEVDEKHGFQGVVYAMIAEDMLKK